MIDYCHGSAGWHRRAPARWPAERPGRWSARRRHPAEACTSNSPTAISLPRLSCSKMVRPGFPAEPRCRPVPVPSDRLCPCRGSRVRPGGDRSLRGRCVGSSAPGGHRGRRPLRSRGQVRREPLPPSEPRPVAEDLRQQDRIVEAEHWRKARRRCRRCWPGIFPGVSADVDVPGVDAQRQGCPLRSRIGPRVA